MPVDFTPVQITVYRKPDVIEKFLKRLPENEYERKSATCTLFLTEETAKRFMRRFGSFDTLMRKEKDHEFHPCQIGEIEKPVIKRRDLTVARRKKFPEYIYASIDGVRGFRCLATSDGVINCLGHKIKLSGRKWRKSGFYAVFEEN